MRIRGRNNFKVVTTVINRADNRPVMPRHSCGALMVRNYTSKKMVCPSCTVRKDKNARPKVLNTDKITRILLNDE